MRARAKLATAVLAAFVVSHPAAADDLTLSLAILPAEVQLMEPFVAWVTIRNNSAETVPAPRRFDPEAHVVRYYVQRAGEPETPFLPWVLTEETEPVQPLLAKEKREGPARLFFGAQGWTFRTPGRYVVRAVYGDAEARTELTVVEPRTPEERKAAQILLESAEAGYFLLLDGGDHLKTAIRELTTIATELPETHLAGYTRNFALGMNLAEPFNDLVRGAVRAADPIRSAEYLEKSRVTRLRTYYAARAGARLEQAYIQTRQLDRAAAVRKELDLLAARPRGGLSINGLRAVMDKEKN